MQDYSLLLFIESLFLSCILFFLPLSFFPLLSPSTISLLSEATHGFDWSSSLSLISSLLLVIFGLLTHLIFVPVLLCVTFSAC
jgi:hypothetical protein